MSNQRGSYDWFFIKMYVLAFAALIAFGFGACYRSQDVKEANLKIKEETETCKRTCTPYYFKGFSKDKKCLCDQTVKVLEPVEIITLDGKKGEQVKEFRLTKSSKLVVDENGLQIQVEVK